ncbi:MAG: hypothetical protein Rpha_0691 [Candidatus Ruthia sp. Apha_13_S6]|nr:hypothetical protein [Candidatus Ruthia sp. Apha_13_S6]
MSPPKDSLKYPTILSVSALEMGMDLRALFLNHSEAVAAAIVV